MSDTKGLYLGKSHAEGGIPAINTDTGQHIEVELNEYKICNSAYSSNKILRYSNKTNKEILDDIHDNFSCRFNKNEVKNGEFIICKVVVLDPTKRSRKGTVRQILDEMQSEKSCNVSQGAAMLKNGGSISSKKTIIEIDFGNYKENYVLTKDNLEDIWSILLNDKSVVGFAYINKDGFDLYDLEPNKTARVQQVIRLWNKSYKYEKESANYSYGGSYNREKMDKLNKLAKEYQLSANKLISKMNPNELMSLRNEADYDVFGNITEYEYGNSFKNGGEVESLISKAILKLNFYETTPEHAKEFGIEAKKPLYVKNLCVSENERLKGIGKKVLNYLEDYARKNRNDVIFGYVSRKASFTKDSRQSFFCDVDMIKNWLHNNGYAINEENNDFHKVVKYADGTNTTFDGNNPDIRYAEGGLIAPNGNPSNLTHEQYKLVRTKAFKDWFGDWQNDPENSSKVVDENGEPKVMYHGSRGDFNIFSNDNPNKLTWTEGGLGFYFTSYSNSASDYGKRIIGAFINSRNIKKSDESEHAFVTIKQLEKLKEQEYDSIYFDGQFTKTNGQRGWKDDELVVFEPNQIKLADGTNTTFDSNNNDIRYEQGGEISEDDKIYKEWTELVNMSASELKAFMKTDEGKDAGLDPKEAKRLGIKSGQESARWIIKMKSTNKDKWTLTMWDWAKRQINFIKRMSGNKGKLFDENGMKTRKHTSLLIWGHDPMKYEDGGEIKSK
jgi:hypothetical protein